MSDLPDCKPANADDSGLVVLPTRQRNALRLLLDKSEISPAEIAALDYRILERAPGIGRNSIAIVSSWLNSHGYELAGQPKPPPNHRLEQRKRKLERAIDYLRWHGYEVRRPH
jgi:hypothetical protein